VFAGIEPVNAPDLDVNGCATGGPSVHNFSTTTAGANEARQVSITFVDGRGHTYTLQFGDNFANPPNYAHVACAIQASATDTRCAGGRVDSVIGSFPANNTDSRITGPWARLTVRTGRGPKSTDLGMLYVPFALQVTRQ